MNNYDIPSAYRYNAEAVGDDPRRWGFVRNTNLPRGSLGSTPYWMTTKRWRWTVIAVLAFAVVGAILVHADIPDEAIHATARVAR